MQSKYSMLNKWREDQYLQMLLMVDCAKTRQLLSEQYDVPCNLTDVYALVIAQTSYLLGLVNRSGAVVWLLLLGSGLASHIVRVPQLSYFEDLLRS